MNEIQKKPQSYLYTQDWSILCSPPNVLCTQIPHEQPLNTASSSAAFRWHRSPSNRSMHSTPATARPLWAPMQNAKTASQIGKRKYGREKREVSFLKLALEHLSSAYSD